MKRFIYILLCIVMLLSFSSCDNKKETEINNENIVEQPNLIDNNYPITIRDVEIGSQPTKLVSFSPAITEIMGELGLENYLVGRTPYCEYSEYIEALAVVGTDINPDMKTLLALLPEYVLTQSPLAPEIAEALSNMGTKVIVIPKAINLDEIMDIYKDIYLICRGKEDGNKAAEMFNSKFLNEFTQAVLPAASRAQLLDAVYLSGDMNAATSDTFEHYLMGRMSLNNIASGENWNAQSSDINPYIIIATLGMDIDGIKGKKPYSTSDAVKNDNILIINYVPIENQSPRMIREIKSIVSFICSK